MRLSDYIVANKERIIACWRARVVEHLSIDLEASELVNELPDFIDDMVTALRSPDEDWPPVESARSHGRHRMRSGIDIGSLTQEMALITEVICVLGNEDGRVLGNEEMIHLSRVVARGTAASVTAYAIVRDVQLARQAREHFSFIAHELRTPLQTAQMATTLLGSVVGEECSEYVQRLERALLQVMDLVNNSLLKVRLTEAHGIHVQQVNAKELVEAAREDIQYHADRRALSISIEAESFQLDADPKLLQSALTNLLKNAVKFTRAGGCITVRACAQEAHAVFEVEDECGGMPEDLPPRLFQPFLQANADKSGFGLGLMIVKEAVGAHQGSIHVNNWPGTGCCFVMKVPLHQPNGNRANEA